MKIEVGDIFGEHLVYGHTIQYNFYLGRCIEYWSIADAKKIEIVYKGDYDGMIEFLEEKGLLDAD